MPSLMLGLMLGVMFMSCVLYTLDLIISNTCSSLCLLVLTLASYIVDLNYLNELIKCKIIIEF